jgi:hypothetical protein
MLADKAAGLVVDELVPGGHAAAAGVRLGDCLLATSARSQQAAGGSGVRGQYLLFRTAGERFRTVSRMRRRWLRCPHSVVWAARAVRRLLGSTRLGPAN